MLLPSSEQQRSGSTKIPGAEVRLDRIALSIWVTILTTGEAEAVKVLVATITRSLRSRHGVAEADPSMLPCGNISLNSLKP
jgi:hypothetical protein